MDIIILACALPFIISNEIALFMFLFTGSVLHYKRTLYRKLMIIFLDISLYKNCIKFLTVLMSAIALLTVSMSAIALLTVSMSAIALLTVLCLL